MARRRRWSELSAPTRRLIIAAGVSEGVLKIVALVDLARRPARRIRGSKAAWAVCLVLINSAGAAPLAYFAAGRRGDEGGGG